MKVIPNASRNEIVGWEGQALKIRLSAPPEKGKANHQLISFLADILEIPKRNVSLLSGTSSRKKRVSIEGITLEELKEKILYLAARKSS